MKRWIKRTLVGVFGATVLLGSLGACSHRFGGHHGWQAMSDEDMAQAKARMVERAGAKLDLDDAQKQRLTALADQLLLQRQALRGDTEPRAQVQALIAGPVFLRSQAEALLMAKTDALRSQGPAVIAALADFYDSLNPAQQQQLRELLARGRHGGRS